MNINKIKKSGLTIIGTIVLAVTAQTSYASGSFGGGTGGGINNGYIKGKSILHKKIVCSDCDMKKSDLNKNSASELIQKMEIDDEMLKLSNKERQSVITYLKRRYKLN